MRWRVVEGQAVSRNGATYGPGEEFDATAAEAAAFEGLVDRVDKPKGNDD